jgi:F-type H+-transporting ATPase subunit g
MSPPYVGKPNCPDIPDMTLYRSAEVFQSYFNNYLQYLRNPSSAISSISLQALNPFRVLRGVSYQQLATIGVVFAEILGFFTIGEIIGKFKVIGYRSSEVKPSTGL